ncbi:MAG: hypothetical protein L6W00_27690 [Lentisphaeria bacterium]|nr:MAG: hypothetical protein L6W00_27690 [Lentisphaeria bacterium]
MLFNYFHDIYPGTAVKRAFDGEVRDLTGYARWIASLDSGETARPLRCTGEKRFSE